MHFNEQDPPPESLLSPSPSPRELRGTLTPLLDKVISDAIEMGEKKALEAALEAERSVAEAAAIEAAAEEEAKQKVRRTEARRRSARGDET